MPPLLRIVPTLAQTAFFFLFLFPLSFYLFFLSLSFFFALLFFAQFPLIFVIPLHAICSCCR